MVLEVTAAPVPLRLTLLGEFVALLVTVTLPVKAPLVAGANVTFNVAICPAATTCPVEIPVALNPAPDTVTFDTVTLEDPAFVNVTESALLLPTFTLPKLKLVGLAFSETVAAAFTVNVAAPLVTLPALLLTTTANFAPLSALVVAGVV